MVPTHISGLNRSKFAFSTLSFQKNTKFNLQLSNMRDRVCQEVVRSLLEPIFEQKFHETSYGSRPERNCHQAIEKILEYHQQGYNVVLDADIKGFFDNIPFNIVKGFKMKSFEKRFTVVVPLAEPFRNSNAIILTLSKSHTI